MCVPTGLVRELANRSCSDCAGDVRGGSVIDSYGRCGGNDVPPALRTPWALQDDGFFAAGWVTALVLSGACQSVSFATSSQTCRPNDGASPSRR